MKKKLVASLAAAMVLGVAGTSFAASNPFVDVPANNWAYGAVSKLAKAGIVDGYGDGTFKGDKTITRYEMAQIVAKAMGNEEKANAEQKAVISKLQAEYADELDKLGVRVGALEKNQPNMKFNGTLDMRYKSIDYNDKALAGFTNTTVASYRLRMDGTAKVDDKTTLGIRFVTNAPDASNFGNSTWVGAGADSTNAKLDRVFATTKIGAVDTTIGRQMLKLDGYSGLVDAGAYSFDGVKAAWNSGTVGFVVQDGRIASGVTYTVKDSATLGTLDGKTLAGLDKVDSNYASMDIQSIQAASKLGKLDYGIGYATIKNNAKDLDLYKYLMLNGTYSFNSKFSLGGEYAKNSQYSNDNKFYAVKAIYGDQVLKAKGQNNLTVQYSDVQANSVFNRLTTLDTPNFGYNSAALGLSGERFDTYKVLDLNYNYAFSKNFLGQLQYVKVDDKTDSTYSYNYFKTTATFKF
jgi:hypothetical protein